MIRQNLDWAFGYNQLLVRLAVAVTNPRLCPLRI
jgi:cation transport ATPase